MKQTVTIYTPLKQKSILINTKPMLDLIFEKNEKNLWKKNYLFGTKYWKILPVPYITPIKMNVFQKRKRSFVKNIDTLAKIYTYAGKCKLQFIQLGSNERALKGNKFPCFISSQFSLFIKIKNSTCA